MEHSPISLTDFPPHSPSAAQRCPLPGTAPAASDSRDCGQGTRPPSATVLTDSSGCVTSHHADWELRGDLQTGAIPVSPGKPVSLERVTREHPSCITHRWCYGGSEGRYGAAAATDPHISCETGECREWHAVPTGTNEGTWKSTSS